MIEEIIIVLAICGIGLGITFLLHQSFFISLLFISGLIGLCYALEVLSDIYLYIALMLFAYCLYDLMWGNKSE